MLTTPRTAKCQCARIPEPIVNTPCEAFRTFSQSGMDALVLGDVLIEKPLR